MKPELIHSSHFAEEAASLIAECALSAVSQHGSFRIALSGGNTPRPVYERLATIPGIPWDKFIVTFGDERCVPPEDQQSNFRMAKLALLDAVPIPSGKVLRVRGEIEPEAAALVRAEPGRACTR